MIRAQPLGVELAVREEALATDTVFALIFPEHDFAAIFERLQSVLNRSSVVGIRSPIKDVEGNSHFFPSGAEILGHFIHEFARVAPLGFRHLLDLLAMLVGACQEGDFLSPLRSMVLQNVRENSRVRMTQMGTGVDVVKRSSDVRSLACVRHIYNSAIPF